MQLQIQNSISQLRAESGVSQLKLAEAVGVTRATIIAVEKGNYNPSLELAFKIALYFNKDITSIFYLEGEQ